MTREQVSALQHFFYGRAPSPARKDLEHAWKAVKATAAAGAPLRQRERQCLLARMSAVGTPPEVIADVMAWEERGERPRALLARTGLSAEARRGVAAWIVYQGLSVALAESELGASQLEAVYAAAAAMDTPPETVDALADVCRAEAAIRRRRIEALSSRSASTIRFDLL